MIIGLTGKKGSGKDTAAEYLVENYEFTRIGFADKLKESAAACFGVDSSLWDGLKNNPDARVILKTNAHPFIAGDLNMIAGADISVREFLQFYGTEAHRDIFGQNFWVDQAMVDILRVDRCVVTDVRFENEAQSIIANHGIIIEIDRGLSAEDIHPSETGLSELYISGRVANIGSKEQLYILLDALMERLQIDHS